MKSTMLIRTASVFAAAMLAATSVFADTQTVPVTANPSAGAEAQTAAETQLRFPDVPADAPYHDAVYKLVGLGVLAGYPDGTFQPAGHLTRAEMCKMINLSFGYTDTTDAAGFPDLVADEWYVPYVLAAQKAGYVKGDGDTGNFRPNADISRQEVCVILCRLIEPYDLEIPMAVTDKVDDWAIQYVDLIVKNFIMPLEEGATFRATEPIKRFELAQALAPYANATVQSVKCTISFVNGTTVESDKKIDVGATLTELPQPKTVPTGMKFVGWSYDVNSYAPLVDGKLYTEDTVLYAYFEKTLAAATFYIDDLIVSKESVRYGEFAKAPINPTKSGYTFEGWSLTKNGAIVDVASYPITSSTNFYAYFTSSGGSGGRGDSGPVETVKYAVSFFADGDKIRTFNVEKGDKVGSVPNPPAIEGYTFKYWSSTENGTEVNPKSVVIKKATNFYAVYEKDKLPTYTVTFKASGASVATESVESGSTVKSVPTAPKKENYTFDHWALSDGGSEVNPSLTTIKADTVFYAVYLENKPVEPEKKTFSVTFAADGKTVTVKTVKEGEKAPAVSAPDKTGYTFKHWSRSENGPAFDPTSAAVTADVTYYAVYQKDTVYYTVRFYADGEQIKEVKVEEGKTASAPAAPAKSGYTFAYWSDTEDGKQVDVASSAIIAGTAFYAVYTKDTVYYTVRFVSDGKTVSESKVEEGKTAAMPSSPSKSGYTFVYWSGSEGGSEADPASEKVYGNTVYYAVFIKDAVLYTVRFMANGSLVRESKVEEGKKPTSLPTAPAKSGYSFVYWSDEENGDEIDPTAIPVQNNTVYYAVYEEVVIRYTVKFVANGVKVDSQIVEKGDTATAPTAPKMENYAFEYWSDEEDGDEVDVSDTPITGNITFYAVYSLDQTNPNDPAVIEALRKAVTQIGKVRLTDSNMKEIRTLFKNCINDALELAEMGELIDGRTIQMLYAEEIAEIKTIVRDKMTTSDVSNFVTTLQDGLDEDVYNTIIDYFLDENMKERLLNL